MNRRRMMTALLRSALVALPFAAVGPAADAATIATSARGFTGGPALSAGGRVVVGEHRGDGALRVIAVDPRTRARKPVVSFAPLPDRLSFPVLNVSGTGGVVAATLDTARYLTGPGVAAGAWKPLSTRMLTVLPSLSLIRSCPQLPNGLQGLAAGGQGFVAAVGGGCAADRSAVTVRTDSRSFAIPALLGPADRADFAPDIIALAASGPMAAWVELRLPAGGPGPALQVVVLNVETAQVVRRIALDGFVYGIGLAPDGTVALPDITTCSIRLVTPASPALRAVQLPDDLCPRALLTIGLAAGRVVYEGDGGYAVSDLEGNAHWLAGGAGSGSPIAFDGQTAYVLRKDCDADRLLALDVGASGRAPRRPAATLSGCTVHHSGADRLPVAPAGRVKLGLRCPAGCRGTLRLVQQRPGRRERLVASVDYAHGSGAFAVRPQIAPFARALAGCRGGLRVKAVLFPAALETVVSRRRTLATYTLTAGTRCRRTSGPPFAVALPAPRP